MIEAQAVTPAGNGSPSVARLDSNESAVGAPCSASTDDLRALHRYPRDAHRRLVKELADYWGVATERLILTNGVDEAIDLVALLVDRVWCTVPGFDAFWARPENHGLPVTRIPLDPNGQPTLGPERIGPGGAMFVARPNNPTGTLVDTSWLLGLPERLDVLCVDETYIDFSDDPGLLALSAERSNVCVFRSLSKAFGLAGLRLGVLIASPLLAANLRERQRFYSVDTITLSAASAALRDAHNYVRRNRAYVLEQRGRLVEMLRETGLFVEIRDTAASFVIARCADLEAASRLRTSLAEQGVRVFECSPMGYPGRLRISIGPQEEMAMLSRALTRLTADAHNSGPV